jgi:hypothetical protein
MQEPVWNWDAEVVKSSARRNDQSTGPRSRATPWLQLYLGLQIHWISKLLPQLRELLKRIDIFFELIQKSSTITSYTLHDLLQRTELLKMYILFQQNHELTAITKL